GVDCFRAPAEPGTGTDRTGITDADAGRQHPHACDRPLDGAARCCSPRDFRGVYLPDDSAVAGRYIFSGKRTMKPSRFGIRTFGSVSAFIVASSAISL